MPGKVALSSGVDGPYSLCGSLDTMLSSLLYCLFIFCRAAVSSRVRCAIVVSMTSRCGKTLPAAVAIVLKPHHMHRS